MNVQLKGIMGWRTSALSDFEDKQFYPLSLREFSEGQGMQDSLHASPMEQQHDDFM